MWSECGEGCAKELTRARPFGEHLNNDSVKIQNLETIEYESISNADAFVCLACLIVVSVVGITMSLCLRRSVYMDIYDRDELIRAGYLPGAPIASAPTSAIQVFLHKDGTGNVNVVVSDRSNAQIVDERIRRKGSGTLMAAVEPSPIAGVASQRKRASRGAAALIGPRKVWLPRERTITAKALRERSVNCPTLVALSVSPILSNAGEVLETPVEHCHTGEVREVTHPRSL